MSRLASFALLAALLLAPLAALHAANNDAANLAVFATPSTSFVSPHEKLEAVNDGFEPSGVNDKSHGCYGNFPHKGTNWVELAWSQPVSTRKVDVYWWDDGHGVRLPAAARLLYWDVTREWKDGDVLSVELPMNLRTEMLPNSTSYVAVFYGPILLAANLGREGLADEDFRGVAAMPAKNKRPAAKIPTIVVPVAEIPTHIDKAASDALQFQTRELCQPADVTLVPINRIYDERYSVYFRLTSRETWEHDKQRWTSEEQRERELESLTVDEVHVGEQQPEVDHKMQSERSQASKPGARAIGPLWRDAVNGGWFSYEMKVDPNKPMQLRCTYWGGDQGARGFDVLVDDKVVATEGALDKPGEFVQ